MTKNRLKDLFFSSARAYLPCFLVAMSLVFSVSPVTAQHDANGNPLTDDQLVNDANPAERRDTTTHPRGPDGTTTTVTRDEWGKATEVVVTDRRGRERKRIKIKRNEDGSITTETTDYLPDKSPESSTTTTWVSDGTGRAVPTRRHREVYDVPVRRDANGKPIPKDSWDEELRDGRWVRVTTPSLQKRVSSGQLKLDFIGTGQTCGHIADISLINQTDQPLNVTVPPMVLESVSGKNQNYACPQSQTVDLGPKESKTVPVEGVCLVRNKPPVAKGVGGDLVVNDPTSADSRDPACKIPANDATQLLTVASDIYTATEELLKDGSLKEIPYSDPKKKKETVVQWCTWVDPRISQLTGVPPATKEDLQKVVYKQVEEQGPMTPETKKKVDEGINTIFEKVELTSQKAKDLEKPSDIADASGTEGIGAPEEISDQMRDEVTPGTQEKPKKKKKTPRKYPKPIQDWWDKKQAADEAAWNKKWADDKYTREKQKYFDKNKRHVELEKEIEKKQNVLNVSGNKELNDKLIKERDELKQELAKLEAELEKGFQKTPEGQKAIVEKGDAKIAAEKAAKAEKEAGEFIEEEVKEQVQAAEAKW